MNIPSRLPDKWFDMLLIVGLVVLLIAAYSPYVVAPRLNIATLAAGILLLGITEKWIWVDAMHPDYNTPIKQRKPNLLSWFLTGVALGLIGLSLILRLG